MLAASPFRFTVSLVLVAALGLGMVVRAQERRARSDIDLEERSITVDGRGRDYLLYVPSGYDPAQAVPLVFVFHGGGGNPALYETVTGFGEKAEAENFILVYPAGSARLGNLRTWNAGHCCAYALDENIDDVAFVMALVEALSDEFTIDPGQIYATGHSNGGMLTYRLAAELSDVFAAVGIVSGTIGGYPTLNSDEMIIIPDPGNPVSVLAIHGMADENVQYAGGINTDGVSDKRVDLSVAESIAFWVEANACETPPEHSSADDGMVLTDLYACPQTGTTVELISIVDGGHSWPGGTAPRRRSDATSSRIDATDVIWEFFAAHNKPE